MANTYTVKSGDNLSTIAQRSGVKISDISGYNTANPNLIRPGQVLTIGGSSGAPAPASSPAPAGNPEAPAAASSNPFDFNSQYQSAIKTLMPDYQTELSGFSAASDLTQKSYKTLEDGVNGQQPLVRQQYAALADKLSSKQAMDSEYAAKMDQGAVGNAMAAGASAGFSEATGSFYQPIQSARDSAVHDQNSISQTYAADTAKNTADLNSEINSLNSKAKEYEAQGLQALAQSTTQMAQLKTTYDNQARSLASAAITAANDQQKYAIAQQRLDLQEQHSAVMERVSIENLNLKVQSAQKKEAVPTVQTTGSGGYNFFSNTGQPITAAAYAKSTGESLLGIMQHSTDGNDKDFVVDYQSALSAIGKGSISRSSALARLQSKYTNLGNFTL